MAHYSWKRVLGIRRVHDKLRFEFLLDPSDEALSDRRAVRINYTTEDRLVCQMERSLRVAGDGNGVYPRSPLAFAQAVQNFQEPSYLFDVLPILRNNAFNEL